jgi:hypothetical protein
MQQKRKRPNEIGPSAEFVGNRLANRLSIEQEPVESDPSCRRLAVMLRCLKGEHTSEVIPWATY